MRGFQICGGSDIQGFGHTGVQICKDTRMHCTMFHEMPPPPPPPPPSPHDRMGRSREVRGEKDEEYGGLRRSEEDEEGYEMMRSREGRSEEGEE